MSARKGRMTAKRHLNGRRKPSQAVAILLGVQNGRLTQVHFHGDLLHPVLAARFGEDADAGRIAAECPVRKRVHLYDRRAHVLVLLTSSRSLNDRTKYSRRPYRMQAPKVRTM